MTFDKDDVVFLMIAIGYMAWNSYQNYTFTKEVNRKMEEVVDYNYTLLLRQARISSRLDEIEASQDSIRYYICQQKNK